VFNKVELIKDDSHIPQSHLSENHPAGWRGAHCDAALRVRVSVDHVGKLFERINADILSIIQNLSAQEPSALHPSQRVFARATET